ncbi:MAG: hypothetical protein ACI4IW_02500 [Oscillospiraceae bacterium]
MKKIFSVFALLFVVIFLLSTLAFADDEQKVTINVYFGALNEPYSALHIEDEKGTEYTASRSGTTKPFVYTLFPGNYSYVLEDVAGKETARGSFTVSSDTSTQDIYLRRVDFEFDCYNILSEDYPDFGASVTLETPEGDKISGVKSSGNYFTADGKPTEKWSFVVQAKGTDYKYSYAIAMNDSGLFLTEGEAIATGNISYGHQKIHKCRYNKGNSFCGF